MGGKEGADMPGAHRQETRRETGEHTRGRQGTDRKHKGDTHNMASNLRVQNQVQIRLKLQRLAESSCQILPCLSRLCTDQ